MFCTDLFMLNRWVCRNVELVGWVAGVDHKETSMIITCMLVLVRLEMERCLADWE